MEMVLQLLQKVTSTNNSFYSGFGIDAIAQF